MHPSSIDSLSQQAQTGFHRKALVYTLVALFGLGTWTNLAGVWIQLPLIVPVLPESWNLPAKLALIINSANVFPIALVFASFAFKWNTAPFEVPVNYVLLVTSVGFAICFAFFWDKTAFFLGNEQSLCLMLLCFFTAIADCLSSTTFIPFLHRYDAIYLNAYFLGEALTSLLPALLGIAQGIGVSECVMFNGTLLEQYHQARFTVRTYFLLLSSLPLSALVAFSLLRLMKTGRWQRSTTTTMKKSEVSRHDQPRIFILMENLSDRNLIQSTIERINRIERHFTRQNKEKQRSKRFLTSEPALFLFIVFQCSAMLYGACQGLTTFSLNAYSLSTFHYTIITSQFAYPLLTLFGPCIPQVSSKVIYGLYGITVALFLYIFLTAKMSPCPPLVQHPIGHLIIFFVWISIYLTCSLLRILMGNYFRQHLGHRGLIWFGLATQIGAFFGAFLIYLLTNTFQLFRERNLCDRTLKCFE